MSISYEDMIFRIQEWFAEARNYEELFKTYYTVMAECDRQAVYMANEIANSKDIDN